KVNIPSVLVKVGDVVQVKEKSLSSVKFQELKENLKHKTPPAWLELDKEQMSGKVLALPSRDQIDVPIEDHLIVELYSR
ncbi:MAG TPA: 30S ribosomal protein S4, partial [Peptococcaceae bacterium]|nr:30S ribosomal protein S4 [Peptococcaceae bacterium]